MHCLHWHVRGKKDATATVRVLPPSYPFGMAGLLLFPLAHPFKLGVVEILSCLFFLLGGDDPLRDRDTGSNRGDNEKCKKKKSPTFFRDENGQ